MGNPLAPDGTRRAVVVMVANEGVMDLVLNYICSAEDSGIDLKSIMVFVGSERDVKLIENMGAQALYNTALGSMPPKAAVAYLDKTFSRMMWFKVTSIFLGKNKHNNTNESNLMLQPNPVPLFRMMWGFKTTFISQPLPVDSMLCFKMSIWYGPRIRSLIYAR